MSEMVGRCVSKKEMEKTCRRFRVKYCVTAASPANIFLAMLYHREKSTQYPQEKLFSSDLCEMRRKCRRNIHEF